MKKTYTVVLRKAYHAAKRRIFAYGQTINFVEGVANNVREAVALELKRRNLISEMKPEQVLEEVDNTEAVLSGFTPELKIIEVDDVNPPEVEQPEFTEAELESMEEDVLLVSDYSKTSEKLEIPAENEPQPEITKELIETLYAELNTWSAVASKLEITTAKLKKYRDEFGL